MPAECLGWFSIDGRVPQLWDKFSGLYRARDGWARIHANFQHHREGALHLLGLDPATADRHAAKQAMLAWEAQAFEDAAAQAGLVAARLRSFAQWDASEPGRHCSAAPVHHQPHRRRPARRPCRRWRQERDRWKACACWTSPASSPVRSAAAPWRPTAPTSCWSMRPPSQHRSHRRHQPGKRSALVDLRGGRRRHGRAAGGRACSCRATAPVRWRSWARCRGRGAAPARHRLCVALRLWTAGCVARPARLRLAGADRHRLQHGGGGAAGDAAKPLALPMQILDEATGYLIAFGAAAALLRQQREGEAGTCRCRWRRPATGCASLAGWRTASPRRPTWSPSWKPPLRAGVRCAGSGTAPSSAGPRRTGAARRSDPAIHCRAGKFHPHHGKAADNDGLGLRSWHSCGGHHPGPELRRRARTKGLS